MKQLPALLEPWRPWLTLFPDDLAAPLGQLLLRLHPQVGPLRTAPARAEDMPEGVGSIVQRGPYERMLISEWAYADAEPDEFLRRAGSGELMFTGPEPAARQRSRRCVALFDAGPAQLGEPRLLHLALFILLARRAQEAGALFEWGIMQNPGQLNTVTDRSGIQQLITARTLEGVDAQARDAWRDRLDSALDDLWIIGGHGLEAPCPTRGQVAIRRSMLTEQLEVTVTVQRTARKLSLEMPSSKLGTRLLRSPFQPVASVGVVRAQGGRPSLKQPPRFAAYGSVLAVAQLDGSVIAYPFPKSIKNVPGKPRRYPAPLTGSVLGAGVFGKSLGCIVADGERLRFEGFPTNALTDEDGDCARPENTCFRAPPSLGRWLHTFFVRFTKAGSFVQHEEINIIALDLDGNLGCWNRSKRSGNNAGDSTPLAFRLIAQRVIGAIQVGQEIHFACVRDETTDLFSWTASRGSMQISSIPRTGTRLFFGKAPVWYGGGRHGLTALQIDDGSWFVGDGQESITVTVAPHETVLGVAACARHAVWGLVVRLAHRMSIEIRGSSRHMLVTSPEAIAQASLDSGSGAIAWIGGQSRRVCVQGIDETKPYLQVLTEEADDAQ